MCDNQVLLLLSRGESGTAFTDSTNVYQVKMKPRLIVIFIFDIIMEHSAGLTL